MMSGSERTVITLAHAPQAAVCEEIDVSIVTPSGGSLTWRLQPLLTEWLQQLPPELSRNVDAGSAATAATAATDWRVVFQAALDGLYGVSVWGQKISLNYIIKSGDRLEFCRPLRVDPMTARRERFQQQGRRKAGLFERKK
jgi:uncharacterized protein